MAICGFEDIRARREIRVMLLRLGAEPAFACVFLPVNLPCYFLLGMLEQANEARQARVAFAYLLLLFVLFFLFFLQVQC